MMSFENYFNANNLKNFSVTKGNNFCGLLKKRCVLNFKTFDKLKICNAYAIRKPYFTKKNF